MTTKKTTTYPSQDVLKELSQRFVPLEEHNDIPILILPQVVLFPGQTLPISSLEGLKGVDFHLAQKGLLRVGVVSQMEEPKEGADLQLSLFGTEAIISGLIKLNDGNFGAILKGSRRLIVTALTKDKSGYTGNVTILGDKKYRKTAKFLARIKVLKNLVHKVLQMNGSISQESIAMLYTTEDPILICDLITPYLSISPTEKLEVLSTHDVNVRVKHLLKLLSREVELLKISSKIHEEVRNDMQDNMRKVYLREQMTAIKRELGELEGGAEGGGLDDVEELHEKFEALILSKEARRIVDKELERMSMMHPGAPEYMVSWNYLNWITELPWKKKGVKGEEKEVPDLNFAEKTLNKTHYGLEKVKDRILDYIAVLSRKGDLNGQVILLLGPPGVGKTTLVKSVAKALGRSFAQISLGGVKDEAEVRGHRRTYIGAMPGKIIHALKAAGSCDPVILLDEVDKAGSGGMHQSDLSSALLEILDPEQNKLFTDHYLSFPFDLSKVLFITTANSLDGISAPLLDRMEVIELSSYTESEKVHITKSHIIPKLRRELKLTAKEFSVDEQTCRFVIRKYTREAGVRQLRRDFSAMGRKIVKRIVLKKKIQAIQTDQVREFLGQPRFIEEPLSSIMPCGVAIGLAYTSFGGDILYIESRRSLTKESKSGSLTVTGSLGKVMKESVQTAFSYILSQSEALHLDANLVEKSQLHIHFPDGATPKDGPSAGIAILSALVGLFSEQSLPSDFAMTGEITLRGKVLPVGGIKEKFLAAHRYGKKSLIFPKDNWPDLDDLPLEVVRELKLYPVDEMQDVLTITGLVKGAQEIKPTPYKRRKTS